MASVTHFTTTQLTRMQSLYTSSLQDVCRIGSYYETEDSYGLPTASYYYGERQYCGIELVSPKEEQNSGEVPVIDAVLRLPIDTDIDEHDRIRLIERYNATMDDDIVFEIEGPIRRGPSGIRLALRKVDDGTED